MKAAAGAEQRRAERERGRYEAYQQWEREQLAHPDLMSLRILYEDLALHGEISSETWQQFNDLEYTRTAETLQAKHTRIDRYRFDGRDIIITESDGVRDQYSLRNVYKNGLEYSKGRAEQDNRFEFQVKRDEIFLEAYQEVEAMMRGETDYDTIFMVSTLPQELLQTPAGKETLKKLFYDIDERKSYGYVFRRMPDNTLEMAASTLYSSDLQAHARLLEQAHPDVPFALLQSHEYGRYRLHLNTSEHSMEAIVGGLADRYDSALREKTGLPHKYGRRDDSIDSLELFKHYPEHWTAYNAYNELLARHFAGEPLHRDLQKYMINLMEGQVKVDKSVLDAETLQRLQQQTWAGRITLDMAMDCRALLSYAHSAKMKELLESHKATGEFLQKLEGNKNILSNYGSDAGGASTAAAARGESFGGCETGNSVSSLSAAASIAASQNVSLEEALRLQRKEEKHCWELMMFGRTVRRGVTCPFCANEVNALETQAFIRCLDIDCNTTLYKESGEIVRPQKSDAKEAGAGPEAELAAQQHAVPTGATIAVANDTLTVVRPVALGDRETWLVNKAGDVVASGKAAERLLENQAA